MRTATAAWLVLAATAAAQPSPREIVDRAIAAQGGAQRLAQTRAAQTTIRGLIHLNQPVPFTKTTLFQAPTQIRESQEVDVNGTKIATISVFANNRGWINSNGQTREVQDQQLLIEMQEAAHLLNVCRLISLTGPDYQLAPAGDAKVDNRHVVGVKVTTPGYREIVLFFDRETGLLLQTQRRALHPVTRQETLEQKIILEFGSVNGLKWPRKTVVLMDGKKIVEAEASGVKFTDKLDERWFARP